jgi:hypothetical protein
MPMAREDGTHVAQPIGRAEDDSGQCLFRQLLQLFARNGAAVRSNPELLGNHRGRAR